MKAVLCSIVFSCFAICSCTSEVKSEVIHLEDSKIYLYREDGTVLTLAWEDVPQSCKEQIENWKRSSRFKGVTSFVSYAPNVVIQTRTANINFAGSNIVCNYQYRSSEWNQFTMSATKEDVEIRNLLSKTVNSFGTVIFSITNALLDKLEFENAQREQKLDRCTR